MTRNLRVLIDVVICIVLLINPIGSVIQAPSDSAIDIREAKPIGVGPQASPAIEPVQSDGSIPAVTSAPLKATAGPTNTTVITLTTDGFQPPTLTVASGTMGNLTCILAQTRPGQEVICEEAGHIYNYEMASMSAVAGVLRRSGEETAGDRSDDDALRGPSRRRTAVARLSLRPGRERRGVPDPAERQDRLLSPRSGEEVPRPEVRLAHDADVLKNDRFVKLARRSVDRIQFGVTNCHRHMNIISRCQRPQREWPLNSAVLERSSGRKNARRFVAVH